MRTVTKEAETQTTPERQEGELAAINRLSRTPLTQEEVYTFAVRLCDNQTDRDDEHFDRRGLEKLADLFVGKTGIFDHSWSAKDQTARIYRTELVEEPGAVTEAGEPGCYLKAYAYMLRTPENASLIAEIEGGIKKEVSVSCAVSRCVCAICGNDINDRGLCSHVKGRIYEGKRCIVRLEDPTDAFEWSFVAVPAQRSAGVVKAFRPGSSLRQALARLDRDGAWREELRQLEKEAEIGRAYLEGLRKETVRLGLMAETGLSGDTLRAITDKLEGEELEALRASYEKRLHQKSGLPVQLRYDGGDPLGTGDDRAFSICPICNETTGGIFMSVAFNGIGTMVVTFQAGTVTPGQPAAMQENGKVQNAPDKAAPVGIVLNKRNDHAAVQVQGFAETAYSGTAPTLGWNSLVADGTGGLRLAAAEETGRACLVVTLDTEHKTMGLFL